MMNESHTPEPGLVRRDFFGDESIYCLKGKYEIFGWYIIKVTNIVVDCRDYYVYFLHGPNINRVRSF